MSRGRRQEDLARAAKLFLPGALRDLVGGVGAAVEHETRRLRYLGPLRSFPPRHLAFALHHDPNWFAGGGYAWDVVRTRKETRRQVNAWLGDAVRLKSPYELVVRELLPAAAMANELPPKIAKALHVRCVSSSPVSTAWWASARAWIRLDFPALLAPKTSVSGRRGIRCAAPKALKSASRRAVRTIGRGRGPTSRLQCCQHEAKPQVHPQALALRLPANR